MSTFETLEALLVQQDPRYPTAAAYLARLGVPSTSIAILEAGDITTHIISSLTDTVRTRFQACSISKPVGAAMSVFRLVEQGILNLRAPIATYLAPADIDLIAGPDSTTRALVSSITIAQLLSHTSGLETSGAYGYPGYDLAHTERVPTLREVLAGISPPVNTLAIEARAFPGQRFCYSGGGTTVVQLIIESVTKEPYERAVQRLVLDPLKMEDSTFRWPTNDEINGLGQAVPEDSVGKGGFARAHHAAGTPCEEPMRVNPEMGAAGLWSTPADLLRAVRGMQMALAGKQGNDIAEPELFIQQALAKEVLEVVQEDYSIGFKHVHGTFGHGGANEPGWRCVVAGSSAVSNEHAGSEDYESLPPGCGIALMTNSAQGIGIFRKILSAICYLKGWKEVPTEIHVPTGLPLAAPGEPVPGEWQAWKGVYEGRWEIVEVEGQPAAKLNGSEAMVLVTAAIPRVEGKGLRLRVKKLEVLISFLDDDVLDIWHGPTGKHQVVKKA